MAIRLFLILTFHSGISHSLVGIYSHIFLAFTYFIFIYQWHYSLIRYLSLFEVIILSAYSQSLFSFAVTLLSHSCIIYEVTYYLTRFLISLVHYQLWCFIYSLYLYCWLNLLLCRPTYSLCTLLYCGLNILFHSLWDATSLVLVIYSYSSIYPIISCW